MVVQFLAYGIRSFITVFENRQSIALSHLHPGQTRLPYLMQTRTRIGLCPILSNFSDYNFTPAAVKCEAMLQHSNSNNDKQNGKTQSA